MKPFLKWAGNKYRIIDTITAHLPKGKRLVEPFAGSAAVFLNTHYSRYFLGESNPDLVTLYQYIKKEGDDFIAYCRSFFTKKNFSENKYYALRDTFNTSDDPRLKSALFIYLNKAGFNGLCRYNSTGGFNVPFGDGRVAHFPEKEIQAFSKKASKALFKQFDFKETLNQTREGDVVYCDPPYVPLSKTAHFTRYSHNDFTQDDQIALAEQADKLAQKGIPVVISNHDTAFTREIYQQAQIISFPVDRYISCHAESRGQVMEVLAVFEPK